MLSVLFYFHCKFDTWNNNCLDITDIQLPYLDTEEQGGSSVHWLGTTVGARLPTESQVHSGKGRKSWNDLTQRDGKSSESLVLDPARVCMRLLKIKQKGKRFNPLQKEVMAGSNILWQCLLTFFTAWPHETRMALAGIVPYGLHTVCMGTAGILCTRGYIHTERCTYRWHMLQ